MMILLLKYWRESLIVVALVAAIAMFKARDRALIESGKARERSRVADSVLTVVSRRLARTDTVLVVRTQAAKAQAAHVDTLRDTVRLHLTDTVLVKQYIEKEQAAAKTCSDALSSCELFRQDALTTISALRTKLAAQPIAMPRSCVESNVVWSLLTNGVQLGARHFIK